jgi:signal transduction histidine kinase
MIEQVDKKSACAGMGLAVVKSVVEIYGGLICVESE